MAQRHSKIMLDTSLLFAIFALLGVGLVLVASASMPLALNQMHTGFFYFIKQLVFAVLGCVAMGVMLYIPTRTYAEVRWAWLIIAGVLLILVLLPGIGTTVNGSRRWIHFGPIAIQVSEVVKLCAVMYLSGYLVQHAKSVQETVEGVLKPLGLLLVLGLLLLLEPDFGATVVMFLTAFGMMFMARMPVKWFLLLIGAGAIASSLLVFLSPYRLARLTGFLHPWMNQYDTGYQLTQSLIAFGRGGISGVGLGESIQKWFFLPEAHTDFILAIGGEEWGLIGAVALVFLYALLMWRGLQIARQSHLLDQLYDAYLAYGITFWMGLQMVVNFGVNLGLLPTKGLTLPLISYGGSSLLVDMIALGILLRVDLQNRWAVRTNDAA